MRHIRRSLLPLLLLGVAVGVWGCGSDDSGTTTAPFTPPPEGSGNGLLALQVGATGSAGAAGVVGLAQGPKERTEIDELWLTFDSIRVHAACADTDTVADASAAFALLDDDDELDDDCGEWIEFLTEPVTVNVMELGDSLQTLLGTLVLPAGQYDMLRLHILQATVITAEGDTVEADVPSGDTSGLKVHVDFTVDDGGVSEVVIEFDLERSIVETPPGSGNFKVKPVIHGHWKGHDDDDGHGHGHDDDEDDDEEDDL